MRVANCSTPVQLFHLLRLQAKQPKKPLVIFSHKSLLRADFAASALQDFTQGGFQTIIDDENAPQNAQKNILCSGKIYWDLQRERHQSCPDTPIRILRLEQLYPFPTVELKHLLGTETKEVVWVQEEPANGGAYLFVKQMLEEIGIKTHYVGRAAAASPATGSMKKHKSQQETIIQAALTEMSMKEYHV